MTTPAGRPGDDTDEQTQIFSRSTTMSRRSELHVTTANTGNLVVKTGFKGYDVCLNSYVGCQMGCSYCYVRFFNLDKEREWGDFVRVREHIAERLPKELDKGYFKLATGKDDEGNRLHRTVLLQDARLVIGTMTDPYQPLERKHRLTQAALKIILSRKVTFNKVGIFTRSPIILDDLPLIVQLPRKRVHYTVTPYTPEVLQLIEPIAIRTDRRFDTIRKLKEAGVRCHVNVAPSIPIVSEQFTDEYARTMADIQVDEFFVDPMQTYSESFAALGECMKGHPDWERIEEIMSDKASYEEWKLVYRDAWLAAWRKVRHLSPNTLPIWSDHVNKTWTNMNTNQEMDARAYGDDLEPRGI